MELALLFVLGFTAALIPGPDILYVLRNTLALGFKQGVISLLGIFSGWLIFLGLIYLGFTSYFNSPFIQVTLSSIGGIYLIYLAYLLFKKGKNHINFSQSQQKSFSLYLKGLLINLSNPKAILFFATIISPFIQNNLEVSFIVLLSALSLTFFSVILVGTFFRRFITNTLFDKIDKICSIIFLCFGIWLLYSSFQTILPLL
ncbi:LysE family translocator [Helicobacter sp. CaF467b]|uniref:LysE family translocator n=1 Tax=Helicobacter sp. CaF467b TaxID=2919923 RepID=UPI001F5ADFD5|nr:LysE family translocator [Helicobacter sp. CaF467b]MCI2236240.1 LysE family translocator [Helicobacter sp. CaF467b]